METQKYPTWEQLIFRLFLLALPGLTLYVYALGCRLSEIGR